ncbi:MAG: hypothetical protein OJF55_001665 [Rhodanobacteraceae bacterium]|jgi:hypothetical protein|nr:MAG: hypothetical protein OJF55_001665 [Rhodanobacteraceae bacterium]
MNPKNIAVSPFVLTACVLMCACTTVDTFTIRNISNDPTSEEPVNLEKQQLVLKEPCQYSAGTDISGKLSPGPLQPNTIGIPRPSNTHIKESIYLIQVDDVELQSGYNIASFIGVKKDGTFVHNIILHSDTPGASPFANASVKIRFKPENCHYSMENG